MPFGLVNKVSLSPKISPKAMARIGIIHAITAINRRALLTDSHMSVYLIYFLLFGKSKMLGQTLANQFLVEILLMCTIVIYLIIWYVL